MPSDSATVGEVIRMCNTPASWKCALILGSVATWVMGILVFGLGVAMIKKPILSPLLIPSLEPIYHGLAAAVVAAVFICTFAFCGCCGAACEYQWLLLAYIVELAFMFIYQIAVGTANLFLVDEKFFDMEIINHEMCLSVTQEKRRRLNITSRIPPSLRKKMLAKGHFFRRCPALSDLITPTAILLLVCAVFYIFLGYCAFKLHRHLRQKSTSNSRPCALEKLELQDDCLRKGRSGTATSVQVYGEDGEEIEERDTTPLNEKRVSTFQLTPASPRVHSSSRPSPLDMIRSPGGTKSPRPVRLEYIPNTSPSKPIETSSPNLELDSTYESHKLNSIERLAETLNDTLQEYLAARKNSDRSEDTPRQKAAPTITITSASNSPNKSVLRL